MKKYLYVILLLWCSHTITTAQCSKRYTQRTFNSIQKFEDVVYSQNAPTLLAASITTETTYSKDLVMDIFMPPVSDTVTKRPVVILAHGGGFINVAFMGGTSLVGTMDNEDVQALADTLAHWGYVTASIEYRLGFNVLSPSSLKRAVWRGSQDMSAAIRFFRKNAAWFDIDPDRVFSGGSSAGALCALHATFVDDSERMPESREITPIIKRDLGALHSRPVVELTGTNPFVGNNVLGNDVDSLPIGIAAYWGAIADNDWLHQGNNRAPVILFHGSSDLIVPYECGRPFSGVILTAPDMCGSYVMDSIMTQYNMPHEFYTGAGEGHEYWGVLNGNWLPNGPNAYWQDIINKTGNYFYQIMKPQAPQIVAADTIAAGTNATFSIANPIAGYSYCWEVQGGVITSPITNGSTITVQFYNTVSQGFVTARAIDQAEVASDQQLAIATVVSPVSITSIKQTITAIRLQPNPATNYCVLEIQAQKSTTAQLQISNVLGQVLWQQESNLIAGQNTVNLSIEQLPKGNYMVRVQVGEEHSVQQLVRL